MFGSFFCFDKAVIRFFVKGSVFGLFFYNGIIDVITLFLENRKLVGVDSNFLLNRNNHVVRFKDALASDVKVIAEESVHKHCDKADKRQYDTHKKTSRYNV